MRGELIGHTDAVWDLALVKDENTLVSCGAEGTVKVWDVGGPSGGGSLKLSWRWNGLGSNNDFEDEVDVSGATSVEVLKTDFKKVAVAYQNAVVKIFDIETGKEQIRLQSDTTYGTSSVQDVAHRMLIFLSKMAHLQHKLTALHPTRVCLFL